MKLRLHSLSQAPLRLPIWQAILEDLGNPEPRRIAKVLGVSVRTVYRWNATQEAPRCAVMALYWLTRWGQHQVNTQATNDAAMACSYVGALQKEVDKLRIELAQVVKLSHTGAANGPLMRLPL
jgi:ADP-ribosylglycohydrolase